MMTPRGIELAGTFIAPVDSRDAAVLFAHGFLTDRHSLGWFDQFGARYRASGYATMAFDFSGCGASDDDVVTIDREVEDLRSVASWLADEGYSRIVIHAHGTGAQAALKARPQAACALVATSPVIEPRSIEWDQVFSPTQLDQLESHGHTAIPNDAPLAPVSRIAGPAERRERYIISKQTLHDLSLAEPGPLLAGLTIPTLFLFDEVDVERGLAPLSEEARAHLPENAKEAVLAHARFSGGAEAPDSGLEDEWAEALEWVSRYTPVRA